MIGWIKDRTGSYEGGLYFVSGLLVMSALTTLLLARSQRAKARATAVAVH
jgi:ACS family tartrate transporter-like MFS transporter